MDQHVPAVDGVEAKAEDLPILLLLDHWTTFEEFGLDCPFIYARLCNLWLRIGNGTTQGRD